MKKIEVENLVTLPLEQVIEFFKCFTIKSKVESGSAFIKKVDPNSRQIILDPHCFKDVSRVLTSRFGDKSPVGEFDPEPVQIGARERRAQAKVPVLLHSAYRHFRRVDPN